MGEVLKNDEIMDRLNDLLDYLDIPKFRKTDMRWLNRNLLINNSGPEALEADHLIRIVLKGST